jgi:4-amino-4-deoxy-L-arabinose transferase-like glycosyltransferase
VRQAELLPGPDHVERRGRFALAIFGVALLVRLVHVWQMRASPFFSTLMGDSPATTNGRGASWGEWIGRDVFYQAPLYPCMLGAICGRKRHLLLVRLVQAVIGSASCALLALAAARLFSKRTGLAAGLMLACYAPAIFFDGLLQKSVLDVFFVCLALFLITTINAEPAESAALTNSSLRVQRVPHSTSWLWLGLAMGGLALTRENALVFILVILAWIVVNGGVERRTGDSAPRGFWQGSR